MKEIKKTVVVQIRRISANCFEVSTESKPGHFVKWEKVNRGDKYRVEPPPLCQPRELDFADLERRGEGEHPLEFEEVMPSSTQKIDPEKPSY